MQVQAVLARAHVATGQGIRYGLGKGGMNPGSPTPGSGGRCDCSGFVAWSLGFSRKLNEAFYRNFNGGWFETTAVWTDIGSSVGILEALDKPRPGAIVVYPDHDGHEGHIGIMVDSDHVVHCSMGNDRNFGNAIRVTDPRVFQTPSARYGWLHGLM